METESERQEKKTFIPDNISHCFNKLTDFIISVIYPPFRL